MVAWGMTCRGIIASAVLAAALAAPQPALAYEELSAEGLLVLYEPPLSALAADAARLYPGVRDRVSTSLGLAVDMRPELVLTRDGETLRAIMGSESIVAYARVEGDAYIMVLDARPLLTSPGALADTMAHELCHLTLGRHAGPGGVPRWVDEGVCQWTAGGSGELARVGTGRLTLGGAAIAGELVPLRSLEKGFPRGERQLELAYEESLSAVAYMAERFGREAVGEFIVRVLGGMEADEAVRAATGEEFDVFERAWRRHVLLRHGVFGLFAEHLTELLFVVAGAAALVGFLRIMRRLRVAEEGGELEGQGWAARVRWARRQAWYTKARRRGRRPTWRPRP